VNDLLVHGGWRFPTGKPCGLRLRLSLSNLRYVLPKVLSAECGTSAAISLLRRPSSRQKPDQYLVHLAAFATLVGLLISRHWYGVLDLLVDFATRVHHRHHQYHHGLIQTAGPHPPRGRSDPCVLLRHLQYRSIALEAMFATIAQHSCSRTHKLQRRR